MNQYANQTRTTYAAMSTVIWDYPTERICHSANKISTTLNSSRNGQYIGEHSLQEWKMDIPHRSAYINNNYGYSCWRIMLTYKIERLKT